MLQVLNDIGSATVAVPAADESLVVAADQAAAAWASVELARTGLVVGWVSALVNLLVVAVAVLVPLFAGVARRRAHDRKVEMSAHHALEAIDFATAVMSDLLRIWSAWVGQGLGILGLNARFNRRRLQVQQQKLMLSYANEIDGHEGLYHVAAALQITAEAVEILKSVEEYDELHRLTPEVRAEAREKVKIAHEQLAALQPYAELAAVETRQHISVGTQKYREIRRLRALRAAARRQPTQDGPQTTVG